MTPSSAFGTLDSPGKGWVPQFPYPLNHLWWGARALWLEAFGFRFDYPIELVPEAGPRSSLHYYIYSDRLFFDMMELDANGVPCHRTRTLTTFYNPAYVAWYGLMKLEQRLRSGETACEAFWTQIKWLVDHGVSQADGSAVWCFPVDFQEGRALLKSPWVSAMIQGLAISALVRAHRLKPEPALIDLCRAALAVYRKDVHEGGVRTTENGKVLFEEYPVYPLPRVLDGFLFSLLGLYDCWVEAEDELARSLFDEGVRGLVQNLEFWDYENRWSWYGSHGYLAPPHYHTLNRLLLVVLARLTGEAALLRHAQSWDPAEMSTLDRLRVFSVFFGTKQRSRLKSWCG
jgi:hypothetical protein